MTVSVAAFSISNRHNKIRNNIKLKSLCFECYSRAVNQKPWSSINWDSNSCLTLVELRMGVKHPVTYSVDIPVLNCSWKRTDLNKKLDRLSSAFVLYSMPLSRGTLFLLWMWSLTLLYLHTSCEQTVYEMFIFLRIVLDRTVYIQDFIWLSNAWGMVASVVIGNLWWRTCYSGVTLFHTPPHQIILTLNVSFNHTLWGTGMHSL